MPSKIESSLTPEEFWDFCHAVAELKGGRKGATLREIQRLAAEWEIGYISENSAKSFRDGAFADFLSELRADKQMAEHIAGVAQAGLGLDEAAAKVLEKKLFKTALGLGDQVDPESADLLTRSVERIRTGNRQGRRLESDLQLAQARLRESEQKVALAGARVAQLEREKAEWERRQQQVSEAAAAAEKKGGITPDLRKLIEDVMAGRTAA